MKIDSEKLNVIPAEDAAGILYEEGKSLQGANLKRSSWLLIAHGLHVRRISAILLSRLAAARSRQDALRVLRIARKWVQVRKSAHSARHGKVASENLVAVAEDTSPARYDEYEMELRWGEDFELEVWGHPTAEYEEWLQEAAQRRQFARTRIPGLPAVSGLQEVIDRYAWEHLPVPQLPTESLRNRLDHATYVNLVRIAPDVSPAVELTEDQMAYLRRHYLADLLGYVENPSQAAGKMLIQNGWALAGLRMIEDHTGHPVEGAQVNWSAVLTWLAGHLLRRRNQTGPFPSLSPPMPCFMKRRWNSYLNCCEPLETGQESGRA